MNHSAGDNEMIRRIYDRRSWCYDLLVEVLSFGRDGLYRREAVRRLNLQEGFRVLEMGCGTGRNFSLMTERTGKSGHIWAVDGSEGMLGKARHKAERAGPGNVTLIAGDAAAVEFRENSFDAFISTYLFSTIPLWQPALRACLGAVRPGGTIVLADDILPAGWFAGPAVMIPWLFTYGWKNYMYSIMDMLRCTLEDVEVTRHHGGLIYIISGRKPVSHTGA